jgi:hypothetical protein
MLTFGQIPAKQGDVQYTLEVSPDGRALTFTFSDLELQVEGGKAPKTIATRLGSLVLPLEGDDERAEIEFIVQGYALTREGTTATVVCSVNGQTVITDVPGASDDSFTQRLTFAAKTPSECRLSIILLLGRDSTNADAAAHLNVTSIDAEILPRTE